MHSVRRGEGGRTAIATRPSWIFILHVAARLFFIHVATRTFDYESVFFSSKNKRISFLSL